MSDLPPITSVFLTLTHDCNMKCRYCFVEQNPDYMTLDTAFKTVEFLVDNSLKQNRANHPHINFFGGEPLLCYDSVIKPLVKYIRKTYGYWFTLSITTNGVLLDEKKLKFFNDNKIGMLLSIDGNEETQNYNRPLRNNKSSFDNLFPKLAMIRKYNPNITFRSTTIPDNCDKLMENFLFAESQGFKSWFTMPNHFETWTEDKINILREQMRRYAEHYIEVCESGKIPLTFQTFERMFKYINKINSAVKKGIERQNCNACEKCGLSVGGTGAVDPSGYIYTCQELTSRQPQDSPFCIGNIYDGVDDEKRLKIHQQYNTMRVKSDNLNCGECKLNRICDGGCIANNYLRTGNLNQLADISCIWDQILLDEAINVMQTLGASENKIFRNIWNGVTNGRT